MPKTGRRRYADPVEGFEARTEWQGECLVYIGHTDKHGYGKLNNRGRGMLAHRFAWEVISDRGLIPDGMYLDHICQNPPCCNVEHLRLATPKQNREHLGGAHKQSKSGVRGVHWRPDKNRWAVQVRHNGKAHYFGLYDDLAEAAEVARAARLKMFTHNDLDRDGAEEAA